MNHIELVQLAKTGNQAALIDLLKSIEHSIYKTAYYFMGNEHDAKDVAQEALIKVYTKLSTFEEKAQFHTWVQRITTNICMDKYRKNKKEVSIDLFEMKLTNHSNIETEIENKMMVEELLAHMNQLPNKIRSVMILRYLQNFSYQEIAETLDLPLNTVKSYLFRGRDQLQALINQTQQGGVQR
ncbi:sigma-70 family RNA polymerase sigma factor [Tepidibacillus infernus]|uniref:RNA polymerase sigma factor n=1 Tax=Tepidibacillus TaxID=1494427 RepID=UPI00128EDBFD|nr:sigma-70 family RNA polymerase sigma factor [Tepidibacillus decaturensis]